MSTGIGPLIARRNALWLRLAIAVLALPLSAAFLVLAPCEALALRLLGSGRLGVLDVAISSVAALGSLTLGVVVFRGGGRLAIETRDEARVGGPARMLRRLAALHLLLWAAAVAFAAYLIHGIGHLA